MMEKLYYQTPYVKEFEAEVISCTEGKKGYEIILDRTGFYPEGGGQPSDTGSLNGVSVNAVHERGEAIVHYTEGPLVPGTKVHGVVNWEDRYSNMQQHSGEHIVSGLIHKYYGYDNVGFHMGHEEMTIDLNGTLTWEQLMEIEREANEIVYANLPVQVTYPSREELDALDYRSKKELSGQVRIVAVPEADCCACCGTHVERTGEIGAIKFLSMIHYKGGVRISMLCGSKAMEDYRKKTDQTLALSAMLSSKPEAITEAVERLKKEAAEKDSLIIRLRKELMERKAESYPEGAPLLLIFEEGMEPVSVRQYCNLLMESGKGQVVAVCSGTEEAGYSFCVGSLSVNLREAGKKLNAELNGRGGGSPQMIQGTFYASREKISEVFGQTFSTPEKE